MIILGVDIGGTGIKAAPVNTKTGKLVKPRERYDTPQPATPSAVAKTVAQLVKHFNWKGPIGCAFPAVIKGGVAQTAANVDRRWIGTSLEKTIAKATKCRVVALNDADAAGIAEIRFGRGKTEKGIVIMVTLGTGIGSAVFCNGMLVPNSELGHLIVRGKDAERRASDRARKKKDLSWKEWGMNVDEYLENLEALLWPDLFVIGGGVSKKFPEYRAYIKRKAKVLPAKMLNEAGIVGAAIAAAERLKR